MLKNCWLMLYGRNDDYLRNAGIPIDPHIVQDLLEQ